MFLIFTGAGDTVGNVRGEITLDAAETRGVGRSILPALFPNGLVLGLPRTTRKIHKRKHRESASVRLARGCTRIVHRAESTDVSGDRHELPFRPAGRIKDSLANDLLSDWQFGPEHSSNPRETTLLVNDARLHTWADNQERGKLLVCSDPHHRELVYEEKREAEEIRKLAWIDDKFGLRPFTTDYLERIKKND